MPFAIGIDLGTANIRAAVYRGGWMEFIPDEDGKRMMPSFIAFGKKSRLFGGAARGQAEYNAENTIYGIKPYLGKLKSPTRLENMRVERLPYRMEHSDDQEFRVEVKYLGRPQRFRLVELLAMLLAKVKRNAEAYLLERVHEAVISVPSYFNAEQRDNVQMAARLACLEVLCICTSIESIALHMYAALESNDPGANVRAGERTVVILDLGASSFNAGLVVVKDCSIRILAYASAPWLGGDEYASRIRQLIVKQLHSFYSGSGFHLDARLKYLVRAASEHAMKELTFNDRTVIKIKSAWNDDDFDWMVTLHEFTSVCSQLYRESCEQIKSLFAENMRDKSDVSEVIIVGGCSRIPGVQNAWSDFFGGMTLSEEFDTDLSEASGVAVNAAIRTGIAEIGTLSNLSIYGTLPASIGIGTFVPRTNLGIKVLGIMKPLMKPHTTSSMDKRVMTPIAKRHRPIPGKWERTFFVRELHSPLIEPLLYIYEGEQVSTKENILIGEVDLESLVSHSDPDTKLRVVVEIERFFHDIRFTAKNLETGLTAQFQRKAIITEQEVDLILSKLERLQRDDDEEADRVAERDAVVLELANIMGFDLDSCEMQSLRCILRLLKPFCTLLGQDESLDLETYGNVLKCIQDLVDGWETVTKRCALIDQLLAQLEEVRTELFEASETRKVVALQASVNSGEDWLRQYRNSKPWKYQSKRGRLSICNASDSNMVPSRDERVRTNTAPNITSQGSTPSLGSSSRGQGVERLFPDSGWNTGHRYSDAEVEEIAGYLRSKGREAWSRIPRIYAILRLIGYDSEELIDSFLQMDRTDIWFPFSDSTLPVAVSRVCRSKFLQTQDVVLSKSFRLEKGIGSDKQTSGKKHAHFGQGEPLPFRVVANLGGGAHGVVEKVVSTVSHREYARKLFRKPDIGKTETRTFVNELKILKRINHEHCVELIGSYSDPKYFALIMTPVADCDLEKFYKLASTSQDDKSLLRGFFGCLAGTLDYLHKQKVIHQDIKPQNILVKDHRVLLADFGISRSWEGLTRVLKGLSVTKMRKYFNDKTESSSFHDNIDSIPGWMGKLRGAAPRGDDVVLDWVTDMLQADPDSRLTPFEVFGRTVSEFEKSRVLFCGTCCLHGQDSDDGN
ncbi:hypothetical protein SLS63_013717 [Diaporthe eres]|uniref:Protein kinase domain-containing protein n=1 Tax=Diaporthe eres TaxID=83184 RepID=A0ABR1NMT2_DIAER